MHMERIIRPSDYAAVAAVIRESLTLCFYVCLKCVLAKCEIFPKKSAIVMVQLTRYSASLNYSASATYEHSKRKF